MPTGPTWDRPTEYFADSGKIPRHELFDEEAQAEARRWQSIKSSQVRRFFGQAHADRRQIELVGDKATDEQAKVAMAFLKATSAYAAARDKDRAPLADFAKHHANCVEGIDDFKTFLRHFEAVVAWHRVFEEAEKQNNRRGARSDTPNEGRRS